MYYQINLSFTSLTKVLFASEDCNKPFIFLSYAYYLLHTKITTIGIQNSNVSITEKPNVQQTATLLLRRNFFQAVLDRNFIVRKGGVAKDYLLLQVFQLNTLKIE